MEPPTASLIPCREYVRPTSNRVTDAAEVLAIGVTPVAERKSSAAGAALRHRHAAHDRKGAAPAAVTACSARLSLNSTPDACDNLTKTPTIVFETVLSRVHLRPER